MNELLETMEMMTFTSDWSSVLGLIAYILKALALYTIAKRREINKPWLAWIPLVNVWILGSISDQYRYVTKREVKNSRKILLGLGIAVAVILLLELVMLIWMVVELILVAGGTMFDWMSIIAGEELEQLLHVADKMMIPLVLIALLALPLLILSIMMIVYQWKAIYDVFRSCDPANATVYLVVSIIGGFILEGVEAIFMMVCRNKDLGMPPRKPVVEQSVEPCAKPCVELQPEEPWVQE